MKNILAFLFVIMLASVSFAADKPAQRTANYIAVFDLETKGKVETDISFPLSESIREELVRSGRYKVIDRGNMNKILGEQKFQLSGCVSGQCIVEAGQLLGVGRIITGSISKLGATYFLSLSLINVQSGEIENVSSDECKCEVDNLIGASKRLARKLLGEKVSEDSPASADKGGLQAQGASNRAVPGQIPYSSPKWGFHALFPWTPSETLKDGSITVVANNPENTIAYQVFVAVMPDEAMRTKTTGKILDDAVRGGAATEHGGTISEQHDVSIAGYPGREIVFNARGFDNICRIYLVKNRLYMIMVVYKPGLALPVPFSGFDASFRLTDGK